MSDEKATEKKAAPEKADKKPVDKKPAAKKPAAKKPAAKKPAAKKKKKVAPKGLAAYTEQKSVPLWVTLARTVMILALAATLPMILGVDEGRRLFWAAMIAVLPVFWVLGGYHLWRRICPLAVLAQLGRYLGFSGSRRMSGRLVEQYMLLQLGLMIVALSLRLTMTNGTPWALVGFLIAAVLVAIITGIIWTGKTWCNYICPVGMVEKFYTEPVRLAGLGDSKCKPCTACKKNCPDIDLEQHYWKEFELPARRTAYFAWPGIVFAFYFYYFLVRGNWDYYFSGIWTREDFQMSTWLKPGLYFLDVIPIVVAAPLTLIVFGALSYSVFSIGEKIALRMVLERRDSDEEIEGESPSELVRHRSLALAGFTAFIIFYWFGGQPTIRRLPGWFGEAFSVIVVIAASAILFRRWGRKQADFVKEKFAEKLLKRWKWGDAPPSENLADIYLVHSERTKERESRLQAYKETVREMVADGLVTKNELVILDSLRGQLGVTDNDHKRIISELSDEERQLFDPTYQGSMELRLQQEQYQRELSRVVVAAAHAGQAPAPDSLSNLRVEYQVSAEEEAVALAELIAPGGTISQLYLEQVEAIAELAEAHRAALAEKTVSKGVGSTSYNFFRNVCHLRARGRVHKALSLLAPMFEEAAELAHIELVGLEPEELASAERRLKDVVGEELTAPLIAAARGLGDDVEPPETAIAAPFLALADDTSTPLRATAIHLLSRFDEDVAKAAVVAATDDEEALVREAAFNALGTRGRLTRKLMAKALADSDPRVKEAAKGTARRSGSGDSTSAALEAADSAATRGVFATLDAGRRIDSLTSLEKMMLLHQVPLFQTLEPMDLEELSDIADERRFEQGDTVFLEGADEDDVYIIVAGQLEVWTTSADGSRKVLGTSGPGGCIGEMAVLDSAPRSASVTAVDKTRTLVLDGSDFKAMLATRASMGHRIIEELVGRLREMIADRGR